MCEVFIRRLTRNHCLIYLQLGRDLPILSGVDSTTLKFTVNIPLHDCRVTSLRTTILAGGHYCTEKQKCGMCTRGTRASVAFYREVCVRMETSAVTRYLRYKTTGRRTLLPWVSGRWTMTTGTIGDG